MIDSERIERCDREIADALAAAQEARPLPERLGILLWEMDWRVERENILRETGSAPAAAGQCPGDFK